MKTICIAVILIIMSLVSQSVSATALTGKVKLINFYGGNWPNSWRDGMLFQLDTTASGVTYFGIRATDTSQKQFLSILLAAKHAGSQVVIHYDKATIDSNGYATVWAVTTL
tara:strand:+ start:2820 stop:3152 length:333 start_codon:yes stop_codon:yes gene_type:complete